MKNAITFGDPRLPDRFWVKVKLDDESGCWLWTARVHHSRGYGQFSLDRTMRQAHRVAYAALVAAIPPRMQLDHRCRVRRCVNPAHLAVVTNKLNAENRPAVNANGKPRGVYRRGDKWFGLVKHNGEYHYTHFHDDQESAVVEVTALRNKIFTNNLTDRPNLRKVYG